MKLVLNINTDLLKKLKNCINNRCWTSYYIIYFI